MALFRALTEPVAGPRHHDSQLNFRIMSTPIVRTRSHCCAIRELAQPNRHFVAPVVVLRTACRSYRPY
jgi:hypothetical protein